MNTKPEPKTGNRIKAAREAAGLTVEEAAASIGALPRTWLRYEAGYLNISGDRVFLIALAVFADLDWLWRGIGKMALKESKAVTRRKLAQRLTEYKAHAA